MRRSSSRFSYSLSSLLVIGVVLMAFLFSSCDISLKIPRIPSLKKSAPKREFSDELARALLNIESAHVIAEEGKIFIHWDERFVEKEKVEETLNEVFTTFSSIAEKVSISISGEGDTAVQKIIARLLSFSDGQERVSYKAHITYEKTNSTLNGEFVFPSIYSKLITDDFVERQRELYTSRYRSTTDGSAEEVSFKELLFALAAYGSLPEEVQDQLVGTKEKLDDLLAISDASADLTISVSLDQAQKGIFSGSELDGLDKFYTINLFDEDGSVFSYDTLESGSTLLLTMEASPRDGNNLPPFTTALILKVTTISLKGAPFELYTIEDALHIAGERTIFVRFNTTFATPSVAEMVYGGTVHSIGREQTVVLPFDGVLSSNVNSVPSGHKNAGPIKRASEHVRLTIPSAVTVGVKGTMIVNSRRAANATKFQGHVTGSDYAVLHVEEGASLHVENQGELYALGFIEGTGEVTVHSGGTLHEGLFISSFRGGTASSKIEEKVFPFDQYTVSQIEVPLNIEAGGTYNAKSVVWASYKYHHGDLTLVGDGGIIQINNGAVKKVYDKNTGHNTLTLTGEGSLNNTSVQVGGIIASTLGRAILFDGTWHFVIQNGNQFTIKAKAALLPASSLTIKKGAKVVIQKGGELTIFNNGLTYVDDYNTYPNGETEHYYRNPVTLGYTANTPAKVDNRGTLIVEEEAGIAGVVGGSGVVTLDDKAIKEYEFYRVEGSADSAKAVAVSVVYPE
jgi:hypothetical protein